MSRILSFVNGSGRHLGAGQLGARRRSSRGGEVSASADAREGRLLGRV